jgi:hypothetical protein
LAFTRRGLSQRREPIAGDGEDGVDRGLEFDLPVAAVGLPAEGVDTRRVDRLLALDAEDPGRR